jgi:hypothetical protein
LIELWPSQNKLPHYVRHLNQLPTTQRNSTLGPEPADHAPPAISLGGGGL